MFNAYTLAVFCCFQLNPLKEINLGWISPECKQKKGEMRDPIREEFSDCDLSAKMSGSLAFWSPRVGEPERS